MTRTAIGDRLLRIDEVADVLGISRRTVWRLIARAELPAPVKVLGSSRVAESELDSTSNDSNAGDRDTVRRVPPSPEMQNADVRIQGHSHQEWKASGRPSLARTIPPARRCQASGRIARHERQTSCRAAPPRDRSSGGTRAGRRERSCDPPCGIIHSRRRSHQAMGS